MKLTDSDRDQLMALAAFRYGLSRHSYLVRVCQDWIVFDWDQFTDQTQAMMLRDLVEELDRQEDVYEFDRQSWIELGEWMWDHLREKGKAWVKSDLSHRKKPWPFSEEVWKYKGGKA